MTSSRWLIAVMGPTASGKTDLAERITDLTGAQLINADAFQMYRGMDIGTGKPDRASEYHLMDSLEPSEQYGAGQFVREAAAILHSLHESGRPALVVGGTGFYIRALTEGFADMAGPASDESLAKVAAIEADGGLAALLAELDRRSPGVKLDRMNPVRVRRALLKLDAEPMPSVPLPPNRILKVALVPEIDLNDQRIAYRVLKMVQNGWIEEVERLKRAGYLPTDPGFRAIGYPEWWKVLAGEMKADEAVERITVATRQYAKRQRTWLRSEPNLTVLGSAIDGEALARHVVEEMLRKEN
jgi:tRNA dimethylallyltransferase